MRPTAGTVVITRAASSAGWPRRRRAGFTSGMRTFLIAWLAARHAGGRVILRIEDLDRTRARAAAAQTAIEDLRWLGLDWDEGPDIGGPGAPYLQSERTEFYEQMLEGLKKSESVYPCTCTRADVARAAALPTPTMRKAPRIPGRVLIVVRPTRRRWATGRFPGGFACRRG